MVTLPIVLLIFISSNQHDNNGDESSLGTPTMQPNVKILTDASKKTAAAVAVGGGGSSLSSQPNIKILADFLGKNSAPTRFDSVDGSAVRQPTVKIATDNQNKSSGGKTGEAVVTNGSKSQVNDLSISNFKFPDDNPAKSALEGRKIIREKVVSDGKETKGKAPVPLYSLVKNECEEGYALDVNGVCQKTITVRSGKTLDSERRRRKRFVTYLKSTSPNDYTPKYKEVLPAYPNIEFTEKTSNDCDKVYPGLIPDGKGGCVKTSK